MVRKDVERDLFTQALILTKKEVAPAEKKALYHNIFWSSYRL